MNIRKPVDYSEMYAGLDKVLNSDMQQMKLFCEIGKLVDSRPEKGAAVAAAEYISKQYPDRQGFSPRSLRRMRDFYRAYKNDPVLMDKAMKICWSLNAVIIERCESAEERAWYIRAVQIFKWSKTELASRITERAYQSESLTSEENVFCGTQTCYNKVESQRFTQHGGDDMVNLPDGYTPLEFLEIRMPRMVAVGGFPSKPVAEMRIEELRRNFPSPHYQYRSYVQVLGMMPEHMIIIPENAMCFLNNSERQNLVTIVSEPPSRIKLHQDIDPDLVLYKFMRKEHIRSFFKKGELLLSTFERCNNLADSNRRDQEGRFNLTATHDAKTANMDMGVGSNVILFSTSTTLEYSPPDGKVEEYALEIHDVRRFFELITQQLTKKGLRVMNVLNGPCIYSGREVKKELEHPEIEKILEQSDINNKFDFGLLDSIAAESISDETYFFKPIKNSYENEYRLLWFLDRKVDQDFYIIKLPEEARQLCKRIKLK